ncbi:MAG: hypothetical protein EA404_08815 [Spirochaetaceae bacterium]|nr:MAG: hypothetical protein EA404_08815 [Spirochaetaceae bacterium]
MEGAAGPGIGETIVAAFVEYPEALGFINGFARNQNLFQRNQRVKTLSVPLRFRYILRLEIAEVYRGTTWEDTCIAEIWPDYGEIATVDTDANMRRLLLYTADGRRVPGYADFAYVLTLLALSDNAEWAISQ